MHAVMHVMGTLQSAVEATSKARSATGRAEQARIGVIYANAVARELANIARNADHQNGK